VAIDEHCAKRLHDGQCVLRHAPAAQAQDEDLLLMASRKT
jgi:hypothetical protein